MSELKEQALLERIGELTTQYENKIADLRVELTNKFNETQAIIEARDAHVCETPPTGAGPEVLEGVVTN